MVPPPTRKMDNWHHSALGKTKLEVSGQMQNMDMNEIVVWCLPFLQSRDSSLIEIAEFVEITEKTELI